MLSAGIWQVCIHALFGFLVGDNGVGLVGLVTCSEMPIPNDHRHFIKNDALHLIVETSHFAEAILQLFPDGGVLILNELGGLISFRSLS